MTFALFVAVTLSAGNAEFENTAREGAFDIAAERERTRLVAEGPASGLLAKEMLARPEAFAGADEAKVAAWTVYKAMIDAEYATRCRQARERLGLDSSEAKLNAADFETAKARFDARYAEERVAACAEQAANLVVDMRPSEIEFERKDAEALKREMTARVAARQKTAVFEENRDYISEKIVEPIFEAATRERKRQGEYLRRVKSDACAPSALVTDLRDKLQCNIRERREKAQNPMENWDVFPSVTNQTLRNAVHRRTMERVTTKVAEIPFEFNEGEVIKTIAANRVLHRHVHESQRAFRQAWSHDLCASATRAVCDEAPANQRDELRAYLGKNMSDKAVTQSVDRRMDGALLPKLAELRARLAKEEFAATWPTLADRTWWPDARTADETAARSDFVAAVQAWRKMPRVTLARGEEAFDESSVQADKAVADAFEIARGAVAAQTKIVDDVQPSVLAEVKERKNSFWRRTPNLEKVIAMLTHAVADCWAETKVGTLWPDGHAPKNAKVQHAELFPSVKKRIELVANKIIQQLNDPTTQQSNNPFTITVNREGDHVAVTLAKGEETLVNKRPRAKMNEFRAVMKEVADKLGRAINLD